MNKMLVMTVVGAGLTLFGPNQTARADHNCGYGGGYAYAAPSYSYSVPSYSYAPRYQSAYVQPSYGYGYGNGLNISFGRSYSGGHGGYYGGHGGHYGGHSAHFGGHYGGHSGGHGGGHSGGHGGGHH